MLTEYAYKKAWSEKLAHNGRNSISDNCLKSQSSSKLVSGWSNFDRTIFKILTVYQLMSNSPNVCDCNAYQRGFLKSKKTKKTRCDQGRGRQPRIYGLFKKLPHAPKCSQLMTK